MADSFTPPANLREAITALADAHHHAAYEQQCQAYPKDL